MYDSNFGPELRTEDTQASEDVQPPIASSSKLPNPQASHNLDDPLKGGVQLASTSVSRGQGGRGSKQRHSFLTPNSSPLSNSFMTPASSRTSHLPTPQSPNELGFSLDFFNHSPLRLGSSRPLSSQTQHETFSDHSAPPHESFPTPESSPLFRRPRSSHNLSTPSPPRTPRPTNRLALQPDSDGTPAPNTPPARSRELSPPPRSTLSSPFVDRSAPRTPIRTRPGSPNAKDDVFPPGLSTSTAKSTPSLKAPVPTRPVGGDMRHIHLQLAADQAEHHSGSVTEARRPDYLKRTKRPVSDLDSDFDYSMDVDEDLDTINPNTGVTESPVKGRRIALFQETSEESFEQSLLAGGYRGYGDLPAYTEPQTLDANNNGGMKSKTALSQRAMDWLHLASPTRPTGSLSQRQNPASAADEPHQDVAPSEREVKKRKRLAAFGDADPPPARGKLVAVEIEGRGRVLMDKLLDERPESPTAESPTSKKRGGGRKKKASARVAAMGTSPTKRGGKAVAADENVADAEEVPKPNWLDAEFPWSMRARERHDWNRRERAEKMKWIERFLDRDSDEEENEEDQSLGIMVGDEGKDVLPLTFQPPRAGRGKMIPLKTNPDARPRDPPERMLIPSDPADARAALLSKRSVRALAFRRRQQIWRDPRDAEIGSDEEVCICRGRDDGRELVQCDECHTWYHLQCIGIRDIAELGREEDPWYCADCLDSEMPRDEPSSEPVFVPTDDEPLHRKRRDPLMSSSSALSPSAAWSATRGIPKTPVRGHTHEAFSSSWDASSRVGPTTPSFSARRSRVYQTPTIYDGDGDDDQPFSLSSPTRSTRFSGGPFTTPKMSSMSAYLGSRSNGPFQTPSRPSRRSGGALPFGFDESVGRTVLTYPYDDTPIRRAKPPREERSAGHMLEGSPLAGRGRALYPLGVPESPTTARLSARKARGSKIPASP